MGIENAISSIVQGGEKALGAFGKAAPGIETLGGVGLTAMGNPGAGLPLIGSGIGQPAISALGPLAQQAIGGQGGAGGPGGPQGPGQPQQMPQRNMIGGPQPPPGPNAPVPGPGQVQPPGQAQRPQFPPQLLQALGLG
jgi:hypothetical protein